MIGVVSVKILPQRHKSQVRLRVNKSEVHLGGRFVQWGSNSVVLIGFEKYISGTRISSPLPRELRRLKWAKLGVLAKGFV